MSRARKKTWVCVIGFILIILGAAKSYSAETASSPSTAKTKSASLDSAAIDKKLKEVLENQKQILANQAAILQKFDAIMEELRIIKVRATIRGGS